MSPDSYHNNASIEDGSRSRIFDVNPGKVIPLPEIVQTKLSMVCHLGWKETPIAYGSFVDQASMATKNSGEVGLGRVIHSRYHQGDRK
jgi:hypothetical protein